MKAPTNLRILLFGASGNVGFAIARELIQQGLQVTCVTASPEKAVRLRALGAEAVTVNIFDTEQLKKVIQGYDVIISALGKSVSLNDRRKETFQQIDFECNSNILRHALKSGCRKFVYVSAFHCEKYMHLDYFRVHQAFSDTLIASGMDYSIIKPTAVFSAFADVLDLARAGRLMNLGRGDKLTNPIFEGDLAKICVDAVSQPNCVIDAGGAIVYSRRQLNEIIQRAVDPKRKLPLVPVWLPKAFLPLVKLLDKNMFDKLAFIIEVVTSDTVAPKLGQADFEEYIKRLVDEPIRQK